MAQGIDGVETAFAWDQALALPQVLATSGGERDVYGLERLAAVQGGAWYYPQHDAIGSVRQWSDSTAAVVGMQAYGPYGEALVPLGPPPAPWGYTGEWQDPTGLVYLRARWYNPALGRFTQTDPLPGSLRAPATRHGYAYALANPLRYVDPSGMTVPVPRLPWTNRQIVDTSGWPEWRKTVAQVIGFVAGLHVDRARNSVTTPSDIEVIKSSIEALAFGPLYEWSVAPLRGADLQRCPPQDLTRLREAYEAEVRALADRAAEMRAQGYSPEQIARALHAARRALGVQYKAMTPPDVLRLIYERNIQKYGDPLGPSVEWLLEKGKTWEDIIESAARPGGQDIIRRLRQ